MRETEGELKDNLRPASSFIEAVSVLIVACIPAYNEEKAIAKVVITAQKHVDKVIVCDDGSRDMTGKIAEKLGAEVISHSKNMGYGAALQSLFRRSGELEADVMVTLDADGQHDAEEIPKVIKPILEGRADLVVGSRFLEKKNTNVPTYRKYGIKAITGLTKKVSGGNFSDAQSGFRAYSRKAVESLRLVESGMGASVEILLKAAAEGLRLVEVPVSCSYYGVERASTHNPFRHFISLVMSILRLVVEERPLVWLGLPGAISILLGVLFGLWMFQVYVFEGYIVTNLALASIAFILIGMFSVFAAITLYSITRALKNFGESFKKTSFKPESDQKCD